MDQLQSKLITYAESHSPGSPTHFPETPEAIMTQLLLIAVHHSEKAAVMIERIQSLDLNTQAIIKQIIESSSSTAHPVPQQKPRTTAADIGELKAQVAILRAHNQTLTIKLQSLQTENHELQALVRDQHDMIEGQKIDLVHASNQALMITQLNDQLHENADVSDQLRAANARIAKLRDRVAELSHANRSVQSKDTEISILKAQVQKLESAIHRSSPDLPPLTINSAPSPNIPTADNIPSDDRSTNVKWMDLKYKYLNLQAEHVKLFNQYTDSQMQLMELNINKPSQVQYLGESVDQLKAERDSLLAQFNSHKQLLIKARSLLVHVNHQYIQLVNRTELDAASHDNPTLENPPHAVVADTVNQPPTSSWILEQRKLLLDHVHTQFT